MSAVPEHRKIEVALALESKTRRGASVCLDKSPVAMRRRLSFDTLASVARMTSAEVRREFTMLLSGSTVDCGKHLQTCRATSAVSAVRRVIQAAARTILSFPRRSPRSKRSIRGSPHEIAGINIT